MNTDIWKKFGKMPLEDRNKIIANVKGKSPDMSRSEIINMIVEINEEGWMDVLSDA